MAEAILWTNFVDPTSSRDKNLLAAERRAHAARISHQRRKAAKEAAARRTPQVKVDNGLRFVDSNGDADHTTSQSNDDLVSVEYPTVILSYSKDDEDAIRQLIEHNKESQDDEHDSDSDGSPLQLTHVPDELSAIFEQPYQKQAFLIWTSVLSERTAKYGFYCKDLFLRIIPQLSMNSPALRNMVLAHALAHQHRRANPHAASQHLLPTRALYHYTKGLQGMCQVKHQDNEFLAAICMASLVEAGQNNHSGTMKHVKGYEEVFMNYQGKYDELYQTLRLGYYVVKIFMELIAVGKSPDHEPGPWTVDKAREDMKKILHSMEDRSSLLDPERLYLHKVALGQWFNAERDWNRTYEASVNRQATLLLLQFAVVLMPQYEAGELSIDVDPRPILDLISGANEFLDRSRHLDVIEQRQLFETLELLAVSIIKNIKDLECRRKATNLLQEIMLQTVKIGAE